MTRIKELDGIRGIAIILVLVWHYFTCQIQPDTPLSAFLKEITLLTWSGVDLFFVLSGFLITGILLDNKKSETLFKTFYIRRICRIFPLYYLMIGSFYVLLHFPPKNLIWLYYQPLPFWSYLSFTQNYIMGTSNIFGANWLGITWSLAIEEQFYLFLPILIRYCDNRNIPFILALLILISPLLRLQYSGSLGPYVFTFCRADSLMSGALLAYLIRNDTCRIFFKNNCKNFMYIFLILFMGILIITKKNHMIGGVFNHLWLSWFYVSIILMAMLNNDSWISKIFQNRILIWFGLRSYGIYLFHQASSGIMHGLLNQSYPRIYDEKTAGITVLSLALTLFMAEISFKYLESPIIAVGHKFTYGNQANNTRQAH